MKTLIRCSVVVMSLICGTRAFAAEPATAGGYHVIKKIPAGGDGGWDYLTLDAVARHLYIARANRVMVFDVDKETSVGEIANTPGVHGVALVAKFDRGFASNGGDSTVTSFDLKTLAERKKIKVAGKPDAIIYDPASNQVFAFGSGKAMVIDPEKEESAGTIELGGKPEFAVSDEKGQVFVNLEDKSEVVAIDAIKREVLHHWPLAPGEEPSGLAIDRARGRLFASCGNQKMVCVDTATGKVIGDAPIGKGTDACAFDLDNHLAFSSNRDGTLTVVREADDGKLDVVQTVETQAGARTMAFDPKTHNILLVTAKAKEGQRRAFEPGTFVILVVGK
jgi:DNA-binding beta-propeller fold protein YncE